MPTKKHRDGIVLRTLQEADMFGHRIQFNVNGENVHKTIPGAIVSLFIFAWLGVILNFLLREIVHDNRSRPLTTILYPDYFGNKSVPI
jgi:hypothetical protein